MAELIVTVVLWIIATLVIHFVLSAIWPVAIIAGLILAVLGCWTLSASGGLDF
jgi:hypothetical protein